MVPPAPSRIMTAIFHTRVRVFVLAVAFYLLGVSVAVLTGIPSAMAASIVLVAGTAWAFGLRAGLAAVVLEKSVEFVLFRTGVIAANVPAAAILVPASITDAVVLLAITALQRAEARRAAVGAQLREKNAELEATLAEVKELRGMLPICAWCKCVRDVNGMWNKLEAYLAKHSRATFTHGICPTCVARVTDEAQGLASPA
jgi:hypothetical protein